MLNPIIESILEEQIAGLRASAAQFVQNRAAALAQAEAARTEEAGALARAASLQGALDALRAQLEPATSEGDTSSGPATDAEGGAGE